MSKPLLIIIGADKGGVGKTTVTRILLDYFVSQAAVFRAFDTESPLGVLKRFFPKETDIVDLTKVADQMKVFDTLSTENITVIDVRAGLLSPTLKTLADVGLLTAVKNGEVNLVILHVLGASVASLGEIAETAKIIDGSKHFLVKNHVNDATFFDWDKATYDAAFKNVGDGIIDIPRLNEMTCEHVENAGISFRDFVANTKQNGEKADFSFVVRGHLRTWLQKCFAAFDGVKLGEIAALRSI